MTGTVEADETFIGGKARNMHADKRAQKIHPRSNAEVQHWFTATLELVGRVACSNHSVALSLQTEFGEKLRGLFGHPRGCMTKSINSAERSQLGTSGTADGLKSTGYSSGVVPEFETRD